MAISLRTQVRRLPSGLSSRESCGKPIQEAKQMTATRGKVLEETTEGVDAGAACSEQEGWHAIKWYQAHQNVRRRAPRVS